MFQWLEELYEIRRRNRVCESCEILKTELSSERREKFMLLQRLIEPHKPEAAIESNENPVPVFQGHKPWRVKQQELETEDRRQAARIMQEFKARVNPAVTDKLEKDMGIADGKEVNS